MYKTLTKTIRCRSSGQSRPPSVWTHRTWPDRTTLAAVWSQWRSSSVRTWRCRCRSTAPIKATKRLKLPFQTETPRPEKCALTIARWPVNIIRRMEWHENEEQGREVVPEWKQNVWFVEGFVWLRQPIRFKRASGSRDPFTHAQRSPGASLCLDMSFVLSTCLGLSTVTVISPQGILTRY